MAKITFKGEQEFAKALVKYYDGLTEGKVFEKAVYAGAKIVADEIKKNIKALPEDTNRRLKAGEVFHGIPGFQKGDLLDSFGLTPILNDGHGFINTKAGFDGYGSMTTPSYRPGLPNQLLAAAVESGSSVREKHPFIRPAVNAKKKQAIEAMEKVIIDETKKLMK